MSTTDGYAKVEKYDELIKALKNFNNDILISAENLQQAGTVCMGAMGSDQLSSNAVQKLNEAIVKYRDVTAKAQDLAIKLARERDNLLIILEKGKLEG